MKINIFMLLLIILSIIFNIVNYDYFLIFLSITWYATGIFIIYASIKYSVKYKFIQFNFKKIISALKSKSKNNISPLTSLSMSLAAKIGVGSLSGVALTLYYGGLGSIFWLCIISMLVAINTYVECLVGVRHRDKINFIGGPSYYITKCLRNKTLSIIYGILIIIAYSGLFLSIQSNTIVSALNCFNISKELIIIILCISVFLVIIRGVKNIALVNSVLVPMMIIFYFLLGIYIIITNSSAIVSILGIMIREAFTIKSIIPVFLIGMQRAMFITESGLGTSAMSASICDNDASKQGLLEVFGIHVTTFIICMTTFLIIATSNYNIITFGNINGIELVMYAFNYHFGNIGGIFLLIITVMFAFSTIISGYFFGENNLLMFIKNKKFILVFKLIIIGIIIISGYVSPNILWNLTDYFVAILVIINIYAILKISK